MHVAAADRGIDGRQVLETLYPTGVPWIAHTVIEQLPHPKTVAYVASSDNTPIRTPHPVETNPN